MKEFLIVDDSRVVRKVARQILEELKFAISEAEDGQVALDTCKKHMPDAILLDLGLPDMDGAAIIRHVRREALTPILVISAREAEAVKVHTDEENDPYLWYGNFFQYVGDH